MWYLTFEILQLFFHDNVTGNIGGQDNSRIHCYKELTLNEKIQTFNGEPDGI